MHTTPYYAVAPLGQESSPAPMTTSGSSSLAIGRTGTVWGLAGTAAAVALAYHGYRRNHGSIGWALAWAVVGGVSWPIALGIAWAQGFGRPELTRNGRRRRSR